MRFSQQDVQRFAEWSGDRNPLHIDADAARRTYFGQTIAHGMLSVLAALGRADDPPPASSFELDIEFKGAVRPDEDYACHFSTGEELTRVEARSADAPVLNVRLERQDSQTPGSSETPSWIGEARRLSDVPPRALPAMRSDAEFEDGIELLGSYTTSEVPKEYLGRGVLQPIHARVLALCSYLVGMEIPGLHSLFTRASLRFAGVSGDSATLFYRARTTRFERQFRMLETHVDIATPDGHVVAVCTLRSYVRFAHALTAPSTFAARLPPAAHSLAGHVALVVGGTRGLGAEIVTALATAGSRVFATFHQDRGARTDLERHLADVAPGVTFLQGDAGDSRWCQSAVEQILSTCGRLDLLILNACAAPVALKLGPDSIESGARYVSENLRLVQAPLGACLAPVQQSGGAVVYISSSFVDEPPPGFGHYVAVKQAGEGLLRTAARESAAFDAWIVRPPRLQTTWNDTPTGVLGAIPANWIASHLVHQLAEFRGTRRIQILTDFPPFEDERDAVADDAAADFTIALAGSFTTDPLLPGLRFWMREIRLAGRIESAPYAQVVQTLLDPASPFGTSGRGLNVIVLRVGDWLRELSHGETLRDEAAGAHLERAVSDFERAMQTHRGRKGRPTILVLCPSDRLNPAVDQLIERTETGLVARLRGLPGLQIVIASEFHARYGVSDAHVHDPLRNHIGHIPYRDEYFHVLAAVIIRHAYRRLSPGRKVVAVDADNTLWRGVVGEVGSEGVVFDASHLALHRTLARLAGSGVLIAICSKNEEDDVWEVFDAHPELELRREHIVQAAINWQPKSQNLRALAAKLNLGLDSIVFVDDNPVECAEVRAHCPEILTLQWPQDPVAAQRLLDHTWEFDAVDATAEDSRRTQMYREELQRQTLRQSALTLREFLESLDLVVDIAPLGAEDVRRASQLTLRTNQFNFTTRRRDEAEVEALGSTGTHEVRTVRVRDRFGDYGLVGLLVAESRGDVLEVDTFLLSCRVLGRGVEHRMAAELGRIAQGRRAIAVRMHIGFTKKNTPARQFLQAIAPPSTLTTSEDSLECTFPSSDLAALTFQPRDDEGQVEPVEGEDAQPAAAHVDTGRLRAREAQIVRAASELSTARGLLEAISGVDTVPATSTSDTVGDAVITDAVYAAFATALRMPAERVRQLDSLEALGCDSLRIVEITVELTGAFPSVPPTLLFEHRSVSEIARAIETLYAPAQVKTPSITHAASTAGDVPRTSGVPSMDIAVVGMHLRCAGANSPGELWDLLSQGRSAVAPVPTHRRHFLHPLADRRPHWAGLLEDVASFDAELFGVSPREAEFMDPQLRLFLEVAWSALEDAGCAGADREAETGVFAGVMYGDYGSRVNLASTGIEHPYRCWEGFSLANRLSQLLGFSGPSLAVDTACSSSGTALHLAVGSLKAGECRVAVVGGVNLILDPDRFGSLGRLGILSNDGTCEPFGADADGTVLGEGAGVVVLRPLADAMRRGDRIYGIIKGTGLSTGSGTVGFTAPNPLAQAAAIRRSIRAANVDPRTISYVETHGTGTALGDPIEVRGLTLAYETPELRDQAIDIAHRCRIGSIKPNIGHLEAGAGVLGLIKVLLQLQHRLLAPSITSSRPNPQIPFDQGPFDVQRELEEWPQLFLEADGRKVPLPRRAGLSSFGVGGANAHVIVEEAPLAPTSASDGEPVDRPVHVLALSGRNETSLARQVTRLRKHLDGDPSVNMADLCFSLSTGRKHFEHRCAITVGRREDALRALAALDEGRELPGVTRGKATGSPPRIAFLFTGQGSQYAGMGREFFETQPVFRQAIDRCATILDSLLDRPLLEIMFALDGSDDAALINQTEYTQPALFTFAYALSQLWKSWGITPDVVLGHSVGEIAAMCVAGGVELDDALRMVAARGRLMQALPAGGVMASVMADEARVRAAITGYEARVAIAAINAPGQVVISGDGVGVAEITTRLESDGIKTKTLTVSHAFHSPLMTPMLGEYERVVRGITFSPPGIRLVSCVDPSFEARHLTEPEYWLRNVIDSVRFAAGMQVLEAEAVDAYIEIGPHPVLLGMGRQCVPERAGVEWLPSLRKDGQQWQTLLGSLGRLYTQGATIDWKSFDAPYWRRRVSAPTYAFTGKAYWAKDLSRPVPAAAGLVEGRRAAQGDSYELVWRQTDSGDLNSGRRNDADEWLIFADSHGVGTSLAQVLAKSGARTAIVVPGESFEASAPRTFQVNPREASDYRRLWAEATRGRAVTPRVVHLWGLDAAPNERLDIPAFDRSTSLGVSSALCVLQTAAAEGVSRPSVWLVTRNAVSVGPESRHEVTVAQAPIWGLGRTAALEYPDLWGGLVDLDVADPVSAALTLARELTTETTEDQVVLTATARYVPRLIRMPGSPQPAALAFRAEATYLITGGVGALGMHVAEWLVSRGVRRLVLTSRRGVALEGVRTRIDALERVGATVSIVVSDVSSPADVDRLLSEIAAGDAPLAGIVHAAGVDTTIPLASLTAADIESALSAKVKGGWLLHDRTRDMRLDLFVLFSSVASVLGAHGRASYAAANAFLDALAVERRRLGLSGTAINWGPWQGGGMATPAQLEQFERIGNYGLKPGSALEALESTVASGAGHAVVADIDWALFRPIYEGRRPRPILREIADVPGESQSDDSPATASTTDASGSRTPAWIEALGAVPVSEHADTLTRLVRHEVAATLGFDDPASVPVDRNFYEIGMDSLMMADLVGRLNARMGMPCSALVFDHPNVRALAARLLDRLPVPTPSVAGRPRNTSVTSPVAVLEESLPEKQISGYDVSLEPRIFAFQAAAWPQRAPDLIPSRWRWMFVESARRVKRAPLVWLFRDAGEIVGHTGSIAVRLKVGDEEHDSGWLVDTMVLPEYRNRAAGSRMMVEAHQDQPLSLSLGQTSEMREICLRLGWNQVAPLQVAQMLVRPENVLKGKLPSPAVYAAGLGLRATATVRDWFHDRRQYEVREVDRFGERHDELWKRVSRDITCAVVRDASYLNWKYVDQPGQHFLRLEICEGRELRGVAIWMFREADDSYRYRRALLVDLVTPLSDHGALRQVIRAACSSATSAGADALLCHHVGGHLTGALRDCGFHLRTPERFLLIDPGSLSGTARKLVLSADNWFVTQGDSDIDRPW